MLEVTERPGDLLAAMLEELFGVPSAVGLRGSVMMLNIESARAA
jgi:hypothetical protein